MGDSRSIFRRRVAASLFVTMVVLFLLAVFPDARVYAQEEIRDVTPEQAQVATFGFIAAAAAFGFGAMAAGIAISNVGAAAMGAISEKPEIGGQALIFIALAEGLVVFGFITALIILGRV